MIVAPEREVPGISAKHCAMPTFSASSQRHGVALLSHARRDSVLRSTSRMMTPPTMNASATGTAWKRYALMYFENSKPEHGRRDERDDQIAVERARSIREEPRAVLPHHREHGAGLDDDLEDVPALVVRAEQVAGEDEVAGRGDRQELGQALDDAEDERVNEVGQGTP